MKIRAAVNPAKVSFEAGGSFVLYRGMLRLRLIEEKIAELYSEQEMRCPVHLCIGQEAVAVGVCAALHSGDAALSGHRAHGHYLAKGGSLKRMLAELYGRQTGCCKGRGGSMHLIDRDVRFLGSTPIVASTLPVATGVAWADQLRGVDSVTVAFLGEGACEEGVWHESLNFAALHRLPIIYVCENNLYSVYTPLHERQASRSLAGIAEAHGLRTFTGDGNDAEAVFRQARDAREHVAAHGPVFMELATYRWREHCGPNFDNDLGYRTEAEYLAWRERDPLQCLEQILRENSLLDDGRLQQLTDELDREIEAAVRFAKESPYATE